MLRIYRMYSTVIKSEKREMALIRRYWVKSFTDLCFCDLGKLTMRTNACIRGGLLVGIFFYFHFFVKLVLLSLPCCSIRSLFGSVHEMNATAYQSPVLGPSILILRIAPSDLNCKLYISNLEENMKIQKLIGIHVKWHSVFVCEMD